ncbi:MAG: hypothetical protein ACRCSG_00105 [Cellulosilyticaceae bacterium]
MATWRDISVIKAFKKTTVGYGSGAITSASMFGAPTTDFSGFAYLDTGVKNINNMFYNKVTVTKSGTNLNFNNIGYNIATGFMFKYMSMASFFYEWDIPGTGNSGYYNGTISVNGDKFAICPILCADYRVWGNSEQNYISHPIYINGAGTSIKIDHLPKNSHVFLSFTIGYTEVSWNSVSFSANLNVDGVFLTRVTFSRRRGGSNGTPWSLFFSVPVPLDVLANKNAFTLTLTNVSSSHTINQSECSLSYVKPSNEYWGASAKNATIVMAKY